MRATGWADAAGWATLALLALLGSGGASSAPEGILLGVPGPRTLLSLAAGLAALAVLAHRWGAAAACVGLALVPLLLLAGAPLPGLAALSGPPLLALALAGSAMMLGGSRLPVARAAFFPALLALYVVVAARAQSQVGAEGDEPHYLMVADSLLRDGDLDLERDYALGRYRAFHRGDLAPHYRKRGKEGQIYSLHAVGLSLLVLPAYAVGGYPGASFFMALLAALLARELRALLREVCPDVAEGVAWVVGLSPPLLHYAGLIFTEVPAALVLTAALRRARREGQGFGGALFVGAAIALLPWLNVRYSPLALVLLLYALAGRPRRPVAAGLVLPTLLSVAGLAVYHHALYGFYDPRRVYGARPELAWRNLPEGLQGLLLDQEFGLLAYAPVFALALPGLAGLFRRRPALTAASAAMLAVVLVTAGSWPMWRGGFNPPARFLVPLLPALAVGLAAWLRRGFTAGAALLVGWGLWTGLAGAAEPRLVHRDRDGTAPIFRELSGAEEWTRLLPGYVLADPDRHRLALVWAAALALAAVRGRRPVDARSVALAVLVLTAAAGTASALSHGRSGGRDAVRLVGRRAVSAPGWAPVASAEARWDLSHLAWGPLYEPHRHPDGAELGVRLRLPPDGYRVVIAAEDLAAEMPPPVLEVRPEGTTSRVRRQRFEKGGEALAASFEVLPGERAVTLLLEGGGPVLLKSITLSRSTYSVPSGLME